MRSIFTFTIAVLILTACSQTPLPSITPTHISTVTPTVLPTFTPITPEQLAHMKKQAKEKLGDLTGIDEKDMQYLPLGYVVSGRTITSAELLLVPEKSNPELSNLYLLTLIGVDKDGDPDKFSNVKEIFSPISTDVKENVVFIDPETGESSIWMSPVPGDDKKMQMFLLGFDGELSDVSVILPITLTLSKGAGKNSVPVNVNAKSGINFVDGENGPEYIHNNVTYSLDTAKGAWVEVPKIDPDLRVAVDVDGRLWESLKDTQICVKDGTKTICEIQAQIPPEAATEMADLGRDMVWLLDVINIVQNGGEYISFDDWLKLHSDGKLDHSLSLHGSSDRISESMGVGEVSTVKKTSNFNQITFDFGTAGMKGDSADIALNAVSVNVTPEGGYVIWVAPINTQENLSTGYPYINKSLTPEQAKAQMSMALALLASTVQEFKKKPASFYKNDGAFIQLARSGDVNKPNDISFINIILRMDSLSLRDDFKYVR